MAPPSHTREMLVVVAVIFRRRWPQAPERRRRASRRREPPGLRWWPEPNTSHRRTRTARTRNRTTNCTRRRSTRPKPLRRPKSSSFRSPLDIPQPHRTRQTQPTPNGRKAPVPSGIFFTPIMRPAPMLDAKYDKENFHVNVFFPGARIDRGPRICTDVPFVRVHRRTGDGRRSRSSRPASRGREPRSRTARLRRSISPGDRRGSGVFRHGRRGNRTSPHACPAGKRRARGLAVHRRRTGRGTPGPPDA